MKKKDATDEPILFRGAPSRAEGFIPVPYLEVLNESLATRVDAKEPLILARPAVLVAPVGEGATRVTLPLPESTPPGRYAGVIHFRGGPYPIDVQVDAFPCLETSPARLSFTSTRGDDVTGRFTIVNRGNVVSQIPAEASLDLIDSDAIPSAFVALVHAKEKGQERMNKSADELARGFGGVLNLAVLESSVSIAPGEMRQLSIRLRLPKGLQAGHSYRGEWPLVNRKYVIEINVAGSDPIKEKVS